MPARDLPESVATPAACAQVARGLSILEGRAAALVWTSRRAEDNAQSVRVATDFLQRYVPAYAQLLQEREESRQTWDAARLTAAKEMAGVVLQCGGVMAVSTVAASLFLQWSSQMYANPHDDLWQGTKVVATAGITFFGGCIFVGLVIGLSAAAYEGFQQERQQYQAQTQIFARQEAGHALQQYLLCRSIQEALEMGASGERAA